MLGLPVFRQRTPGSDKDNAEGVAIGKCRAGFFAALLGRQRDEEAPSRLPSRPFFGQFVVSYET